MTIEETYSCNILRSLGQRFKILTFLQTYYLYTFINYETTISIMLSPLSFAPSYSWKGILFLWSWTLCHYVQECETMMNYIHAKETAIHSKNKPFAAFVDWNLVEKPLIIEMDDILICVDSKQVAKPLIIEMHDTLITIPRGDQKQERWSELCNYHWSIACNLWYPREFNTRVGPFFPTQYQFYVIYIFISSN